MRICWILLFVYPMVCRAETKELAPDSEEESLFIRRIADFWQEKEYRIAKFQMEEFIEQFPTSQFADPLSAALGDLLLREKNFSGALSHYTKIKSPEWIDRIFLSRMECLYQMQWYATLAEDCEMYLESKDDLNPTQKLHATYFLAIGLYQQCLNASKNPETLQKLAKRAEPYFQILFESELSHEVAEGFAHLSCILKDFSKASQIYLDLAGKDPALQEEMLFQAALIQSEYDKELALLTFEEISKLGQKRAKDATYNRLVLYFETGRHQELVKEKEALFKEIPSERSKMAHLFLGQSLIALKRYDEGTAELQGYIQDAPVSATLHTALLALLESASKTDDLATLDYARAKLSENFPQDPQLPKAHFSRAQILKRTGQLDQAREELQKILTDFPQFDRKEELLLELAQIHYREKMWELCREDAKSFLAQFPTSPLTSSLWRYLASSSAEIANKNPKDVEVKEQLVLDLTSLLNQKDLFPCAEQNEWELILAKTHFELQSYEEAIAILERLPQQPNATLLLALAYREGRGDLPLFCQTAEAALAQNATLMEPHRIHAALFNAYLALADNHVECFEKGAEHLMAALEGGGEIQNENLLWLVDFYYNRLEENPSLAKKTAHLLESYLKRPDFEPLEASIYESSVSKLAKVYSLLQEGSRAIPILEKLMVRYKEMPDLQWSSEKEVQLLLASQYIGASHEEKGAELLNSILAANPTLRNPISASASLMLARLKFAQIPPQNLRASEAEVGMIAGLLKNLVLQKSLPNEPLHLEAALDYISLQTKLDPSLEKKISLLQKTKSDFERSDDLLSKDYHAAFGALPQKEKIYRGYMRLMDAVILTEQAKLAEDPILQKELQANAKDLLLKIIEEPCHPDLTGRAQLELKNRD
ncbi:MAG: tetratricopeptide repeat protein [Chlamydiota bacterium]